MPLHKPGRFRKVRLALVGVAIVGILLIAVVGSSGFWRDGQDIVKDLRSGGSFWVLLVIVVAITFFAQWPEIKREALAILGVAHKDDGPLVPKADVFIRHEPDYQGGAAQFFSPAWDEVKEGERAVVLPLVISATSDTLLEQLELDIAGQRCESTLVSDWLSLGVVTGGRWKFSIPDSVKGGPRTVAVVGLAEGRWYSSPLFQIDVPQAVSS